MDACFSYQTRSNHANPIQIRGRQARSQPDPQGGRRGRQHRLRRRGMRVDHRRERPERHRPRGGPQLPPEAPWRGRAQSAGRGSIGAVDMKPLTYETLRDDPELLEALMRQARRARAEAVYRIVVAPVAELFAPLELEDVQRRAVQG